MLFRSEPFPVRVDLVRTPPFFMVCAVLQLHSWPGHKVRRRIVTSGKYGSISASWLDFTSKNAVILQWQYWDTKIKASAEIISHLYRRSFAHTHKRCVEP